MHTRFYQMKIKDVSMTIRVKRVSDNMSSDRGSLEAALNSTI